MLMMWQREAGAVQREDAFGRQPSSDSHREIGRAGLHHHFNPLTHRAERAKIGRKTRQKRPRRRREGDARRRRVPAVAVTCFGDDLVRWMLFLPHQLKNVSHVPQQ